MSEVVANFVNCFDHPALLLGTVQHQLQRESVRVEVGAVPEDDSDEDLNLIMGGLITDLPSTPFAKRLAESGMRVCFPFSMASSSPILLVSSFCFILLSLVFTALAASSRDLISTCCARNLGRTLVGCPRDQETINKINLFCCSFPETAMTARRSSCNRR